MKRIVFDSYALIALFREEPGHEIVRDLLLKMANDESEGYITAVNVGEIYYMISRKSSTKHAEMAINAIKQMQIIIIEPDLKLCLEAAAIKAKNSLSYADAFAAALTINKKAVLITGDKEFDSLIGEANFKVKYL
ncbi:MAG TPA: type II toxin-antitoxin system VapC family toxin [Ferruginibacter sp.]|nr:type II toxin-antitoxin system VapC family toxin [Ferruginibacter sp.]